MIKTSLIAACLAVASLAATSTPASAEVSINVQFGPPPLRIEYAPAPRHGQIWAPGHWEWNGRAYIWSTGIWMQARPGYSYIQPAWVQRGNRWEMHRGGWERGGADRGGHGREQGHGHGRFSDRDRDGVPDRYDARPNNPYRY